MLKNHWFFNMFARKRNKTNGFSTFLNENTIEPKAEVEAEAEAEANAKGRGRGKGSRDFLNTF